MKTTFKFRLIGRTTVFHGAYCYLAAGFIPTIVGISEDGRYMTTARVVDTITL